MAICKKSGMTRISVCHGFGIIPALGESVALNGCCLTVEESSDTSFSASVSSETLKSTTLGSMKKGSSVNLERSLRADSFIGGHYVSGHIDTKGTISRIIRRTDGDLVHIRFPSAFMKNIVPKGSVAIDGISLTVSSVMGNTFTVCLIPETVKRTTLLEKTQGSLVNIEFDMMGKYALLGKK